MKSLLILVMCLFASSADAKFSVKRNNNMAFGTIASSVDGSGTAVINTNSNTKYLTGSIFDFGGTVARAKFQVSGGTPSGFVTITLPSPFTVSKSGVTLTVDNLAMDIATSAQLDSTGKLTFHVGGRLTVPTNQAPKSGLTGNFVVIVDDDSASKTDDASATVSASIVAPVSVSETTALSFGNIAATSVGGTLAVSTNGTTTAININEMAGTPVSEGVFEVTGDGGASFSVTLPSSATLSSGGNSMTVNNFNHDGGVSPAIAGGGSRDLSVGATLNIGANQAAGAYSGSFTITVNYN